MKQEKENKRHTNFVMTIGRTDSAITLIALSVTIIIILILSGVSISAVKGQKGLIKESKTSTAEVQRESIIEKIEADLYNEKVKKGKMPTENDLINLTSEKGYGTVTQENGENVLTTTDGEYQILFSEILGWEATSE